VILFIRRLLTTFALMAIVLAGSAALIIGLNFPYQFDQPPTRQDIEAAQRFYDKAYQAPKTTESQSEYETEYLRVAEWAATIFNVEREVRAFVDKFQLKDKTVLEIGSGRGYLQDIVNDYTGLDISPTVARFYHKKFVLGSATAMPFAHNTFDAIWSVWVFEHVPNPEQALFEARRVTKNGGLLFLWPAWNVPSWLGDGYEVRAYSDFGILGKIAKASIPLRKSRTFRALTTLPVRGIRTAAARFGPTTLRYQRLTPNYEKYWGPDSDAVNSIDVHEAMLWFISRGDKCVNCGEAPIFLPVFHMPLIIRVQKPGPLF